MRKKLSHQVDLGPSMLDVKYKELGGTCLVTTPLSQQVDLGPSMLDVKCKELGGMYRFGNYTTEYGTKPL